MLQKFQSNKVEDSQFYFSYIVNDDCKYPFPLTIYYIPYMVTSYVLNYLGAMKHLFWTDSTWIEDYMKYGAAVTFDTTQNTYRYKLIFEMLCRVNNHHRSILFASGILANETSESFIWLFAEFKKCISKSLETIITNQDRTMNVALATELSDTFHKLCK